jgi:hypothetical protein
VTLKRDFRRVAKSIKGACAGYRPDLEKVCNTRDIERSAYVVQSPAACILLVNDPHDEQKRNGNLAECCTVMKPLLSSLH